MSAREPQIKLLLPIEFTKPPAPDFQPPVPPAILKHGQHFIVVMAANQNREYQLLGIADRKALKAFQQEEVPKR